MQIKLDGRYGTKELPAPSYATEGSAGLDLRVLLPEGKYQAVLKAGQCKKFSSGVSVWIKDKGLAGIIVPRSGLGSKHGIVIANTVGIIDSDYQGEIGLTLWNRSKFDYVINHGERVAQMIFMPVVQPKFEVVDEFSDSTERGTGGFGSTGAK